MKKRQRKKNTKKKMLLSGQERIAIYTQLSEFYETDPCYYYQSMGQYRTILDGIEKKRLPEGEKNADS